MSDLISRADAMGAVQDHFNADGFKGYDDGQQMMDRIKALPSAEPKTGEWVQKDMYADRFCSECNYAVWDSEAEEYNFCPNCGARMYKGGDTE